MKYTLCEYTQLRYEYLYHKSKSDDKKNAKHSRKVYRLFKRIRRKLYKGMIKGETDIAPIKFSESFLNLEVEVAALLEEWMDSLGDCYIILNYIPLYECDEMCHYEVVYIDIDDFFEFETYDKMVKNFRDKKGWKYNIKATASNNISDYEVDTLDKILEDFKKLGYELQTPKESNFLDFTSENASILIVNNYEIDKYISKHSYWIHSNNLEVPLTKEEMQLAVRILKLWGVI